MDTKSAPKFSVALIAKNEEKSLPNLLASLWEFRERGGEIILVDTGSTDTTCRIAEAFGAKVWLEGDRFRHSIDQELADLINSTFILPGEEPIVKAGDGWFDFGEARDYAMKLAKNNYVLCPGCDEVFKTLDIDALNGFIDEGFTQIRFDYIWNMAPDGTPRVRFYRDAYFFDRTKWHWIGCIHETVTENKPGEKWMELPTQFGLVEHHQLPQDGRSNRDVTGLAASCLLDPDNDRHTHYFARQLMYEHRYRSAIAQFVRHVNLQKWDLERGQSMTFIGDCYLYMGDEKTAIRWYQDSFSFCAARRAPLMNLARLYHKRNDYRHAAAYANAALAIPYIAYYANNVSDYQDAPHEILYWALWYLGDKEGSKAHWQKCIEFAPGNVKYAQEGAQFFGYGPK
jgi:glycosyltransferase involved in cell wall biosynthesis